MTAQDFAALSNTAIAFAGVVYVLAFLSHLVEMTFGRRVPTAADRRVHAGEGTAHEQSERPGSVATLPPTTTGAEVAAVRTETFARIGVALTVVAALLHALALVTRGLGAEPARVPWGNMYEFSVAGTFGVTALYLLLLRRYRLRWLGPVVTGFDVVVLMLAVLLLYEDAGPLVPALNSYWLVIHVVAAIIATGAFTVGGMASLLFLLKQRAVAREQQGRVRGTGYVARLPEPAVLDRVAYRMHAFGFPIWTFAALIAGPIWAEYAWGRYWGWDPKEVWAFITWVAYAAYLHARATAGWRGRSAAIIALVALATLLFNFIGINFFFGDSSQHSYAAELIVEHPPEDRAYSGFG